MATPIDPDFRSRLQALSDKFALGVPALMSAIGQALAACRTEGLGALQLTALHRALHAVAGSAGTFGFGALGQECRRIEQLLRPLMDDAAAAGREWPLLAPQIDQLLAWAAVDPKATPYVPLPG
ncbi:Hpt domain-containing protein [Janthinobacterium agaricidamnosum]|uniref:Hpt domain protein n=1 Tax=Janthinobacterium agaricidamnosum NBRC 102515 = DSM 9628 TaxID=1349767 RepID=W0V6J1_9BURK|nr:Hpt domain-containing protein [Janthinobacterium agaricidamnosum]CDG82897.1 hpt domain protein [Janthinobacterium agaricidamnosum NBRC 102515 = DSM 9628]